MELKSAALLLLSSMPACSAWSASSSVNAGRREFLVATATTSGLLVPTHPAFADEAPPLAEVQVVASGDAKKVRRLPVLTKNHSDSS